MYLGRGAVLGKMDVSGEEGRGFVIDLSLG